MRLDENFLLALRNIWGSKTRTLLTMLGIIIGVTAVIVIVGLGNGMVHYRATTWRRAAGCSIWISRTGKRSA